MLGKASNFLKVVSRLKKPEFLLVESAHEQSGLLFEENWLIYSPYSHAVKGFCFAVDFRERLLTEVEVSVPDLLVFEEEGEVQINETPVPMKGQELWDWVPLLVDLRQEIEVFSKFRFEGEDVDLVFEGRGPKWYVRMAVATYLLLDILVSLFGWEGLVDFHFPAMNQAIEGVRLFPQQDFELLYLNLLKEV
jgi:hypothetical protein